MRPTPLLVQLNHPLTNQPVAIVALDQLPPQTGPNCATLLANSRAPTSCRATRSKSWNSFILTASAWEIKRAVCRRHCAPGPIGPCEEQLQDSKIIRLMNGKPQFSKTFPGSKQPISEPGKNHFHVYQELSEKSLSRTAGKAIQISQPSLES
jgi:hypothetical protein